MKPREGKIYKNNATNLLGLLSPREDAFLPPWQKKWYDQVGQNDVLMLFVSDGYGDML